MLKSMTGFGQACGIVLDRSITVEIRSVNNRYRDVVVKVPRAYAATEEFIKKMVGEQVSRGRLDVWVQVDEMNALGKSITLDIESAKTYHRLLETLQQELGLDGTIKLSDLTQFTDIFKHEVEKLDMDAYLDGLAPIVDIALERLSDMRSTEGHAIAADFGQRLDLMADSLNTIEDRRQVVVDECKTKIEARIQNLIEGPELDEGRLLQEVAYIIDRSDITEEVVRLRSHFRQFQTLIAGDGAVGRRLDFLLQEINREVNTIGSKSSDVHITNCVVNLKTELEKLREQVQNVE
jgi:uncharacterized protein (TIGR00255 family)